MGMLCLSPHVEGLVRNVPAAFAHYRLAASQGLDDAQFRLGEIDVLDDDMFVPNRWFRQAANQGHPEACFDIAQFYHHGMGGIDEDLAVANSILLVQDGT